MRGSDVLILQPKHAGESGAHVNGNVVGNYFRNIRTEFVEEAGKSLICRLLWKRNTFRKKIFLLKDKRFFSTFY